MFEKSLRPSVEKSLRPVGANLRKSGITADHVTLLGIVAAVGAGIAIANGALRLGFVLGGVCALSDVLDGAVAKTGGNGSARGAFFDSVADRVTDAVFLGGIAWYLAGAGYDLHIAVLPLAVLAASMLISYERARAESLGFDARGGLMERAERLALLGIGILFEGLLIPVLWLMLVLTLFTAGQRFVKVWRQANSPNARREPARWRSRRAGRTTSERARVRRERWMAARRSRRGDSAR